MGPGVDSAIFCLHDRVMFDELREAFRQAVDNFNRELDASTAGEADHLIGPMAHGVALTERKHAEAAAALGEVRSELSGLDEELTTCRRRERLALDAGDAETVQVAREYEAKLVRRMNVLDRKAQALADECELLESELSEMQRQLTEARATIAAQAPADDADDPLDLRVDPWSSPPARDIDFDERLAELKRRMNSSD